MDTWYDERYKFYYASSYHNAYQCPQDDWNSKHFVSFDTQGNVIGLIIYEVAFDFGSINFTDNKVVFGKDLFKVLDDIFCKLNIPKMEFCCVIGNPI